MKYITDSTRNRDLGAAIVAVPDECVTPAPPYMSERGPMFELTPPGSRRYGAGWEYLLDYQVHETSAAAAEALARRQRPVRDTARRPR